MPAAAFVRKCQSDRGERGIMPSRIFVVAEDRDVIAPIRHHLVGAGFEVFHVLDGAEGLATTMRELPDLLITDADMPECDGFAQLSILRLTASTRMLPVVLLTALDDHDFLTRAIRLGANGHLPKPIRRDALLNTVAVMLNNKRLELSTVKAEGFPARKVLGNGSAMATRL